MSEERGVPKTGDEGDGPAPGRIGNRLAPPGVLAIGLYLLVLSGVLILGVAGGHYPVLFLILAAAFMSASGGLILMLRWAWALALAAVFLLASYYLWFATSQHATPLLVQGLLNLVFFLYLIRTEVRSRLR